MKLSKTKIKKHMSTFLVVLIIGSALPLSIFATDIASQFLTGTDAFKTDTNGIRTNTDAVKTNTDADLEEECLHNYANFIPENDGTEDMPASRTGYCIRCGKKGTISFYDYISDMIYTPYAIFYWANDTTELDCSYIFAGEFTEKNIDNLILAALYSRYEFKDSEGMAYSDYPRLPNYDTFERYAYGVPLRYMKELFLAVYGIENVDFSISTRYDVKKEILYDWGGAGRGPEGAVVSFENGQYVVRRYFAEYINDELILDEDPYIAITFDRDAHITGVYFPDIDKRNHSIVNYDAKTPTCTEIGWDAYEKCKYCDYTTYVEIPAKGHIYDSVITEATCTKDGYTTHTCSVCGYVHKDSVVTASGHKEYFIPAVEPTCTEEGLTMGKGCETCGEVLISQEVIPSKGHSFSNWITILDATCVTNGKRIKICSCGLFEEDIIISTGHNLTDWITVSDATCDENGKKIRLCFCGYSEQETIRAYGHADKNGDGYCDECSFAFDKGSNSDTSVDNKNIFSTLKNFFIELFSFIEKIFVFWK